MELCRHQALLSKFWTRFCARIGMRLVSNRARLADQLGCLDLTESHKIASQRPSGQQTSVTKLPTCAQLQLWACQCRVWCLSGRARAVCCVLRATDRSNCRSIGAPIEQSAIPIRAQNLGTLTIPALHRAGLAKSRALRLQLIHCMSIYDLCCSSYMVCCAF